MHTQKQMIIAMKLAMENLLMDAQTMEETFYCLNVPATLPQVDVGHIFSTLDGVLSILSPDGSIIPDMSDKEWDNYAQHVAETKKIIALIFTH